MYAASQRASYAQSEARTSSGPLAILGVAMAICCELGCPHRQDRNGRCDSHAKAYDRRRQRLHWRSGGSSLAERQAEWDRFQGVCQGCGGETIRPGDRGTFAPPGIREHIVALADGGADDEKNTTWLCEPCADRKTRIARKQGLSG